MTVRERQSPSKVGRVLLVEELALSEVGRERRDDREHTLLLHEPARLGQRGRRISLVVSELDEVDLATTRQLAVAVCTARNRACAPIAPSPSCPAKPKPATLIVVSVTPHASL